MQNNNTLTVKEVECEILQALPIQAQTPANIQWLQRSLAQHTAAEVWEKCKESFEIDQRRLSQCESRLAEMGVLLNAHIKYTSQRFNEYDDRLARIERNIEVNQAISNTRYEVQRDMNTALSNGINSAHQSHVQSSKSTHSYFDFWGIWLLLIVAIPVINSVSSNINNAPRPAQAQQVIRSY